MALLQIIHRFASSYCAKGGKKSVKYRHFAFHINVFFLKTLSRKISINHRQLLVLWIIKSLTFDCCLFNSNFPGQKHCEVFRDDVFLSTSFRDAWQENCGVETTLCVRVLRVDRVEAESRRSPKHLSKAQHRKFKAFHDHFWLSPSPEHHQRVLQR